MIPLVTMLLPPHAALWDIPGEHSKMSQLDLKALIWLMLPQHGNIVEVGCSDGQTTELLARTFPHRTIYACDYTADSIPHAEQISEQPSPITIAAHARGLPNVTIIDTLSIQLPYHALNDIRAVFIDADHRYDAVRSDTERALATFALRGPAYQSIIIWHDCYDGGPDWLGVKRYLETEVTPLRPVYWIDGTWIAYTLL